MRHPDIIRAIHAVAAEAAAGLSEEGDRGHDLTPSAELGIRETKRDVLANLPARVARAIDRRSYVEIRYRTPLASADEPDRKLVGHLAPGSVPGRVRVETPESTYGISVEWITDMTELPEPSSR